MVDIVDPDSAAGRHWHAGWTSRLRRWYADLGAPTIAEQIINGWDQARTRTVGVIRADGVEAGHVAVCVPTRQDRDDLVGTVFDLWVEPAYRGRGLGRAARDQAERWSRALAPKIGVLLWGDDPAARALYSSYPVRYQKMIKELGEAPVVAPGVTARPMAEAEFAAWRAAEVISYAADLADSGTLPPDDAHRVAATSYDSMLPDGLATPGYEWSVVEAEGQPVASIWICHDASAGFSFVYSVEALPQHRGKGYGRAAMQFGEVMTLRFGHRYLALNVFGHNTVATNLYRSLGYRLMDQSRSIASA